MRALSEIVSSRRWLLLAVVLAWSAFHLWPELTIDRVDVNDNISHFALVERVVWAVEHGANPVDTQSPEWTFGFPVLRDYQPLAHLLVAGLYYLFGKSVPLMTVFIWVRFLSVLLFPLSFYAAARLLELPVPASLASAVMAPLIASNNLFGIEFGSYVWAGNGLFPQSVAAHLFVLSLGFGFQAIHRGRRITTAGVLVGLTFVAHLIYGYMGAVSLALLAVLPDSKVPRRTCFLRLLRIGGITVAVAAFQLLPLILDGPILNHSRWEPVWKWDSFGAPAVLDYLFSGRILDAGRLPVLSLAALGGVLIVAWKWRKASLAERFAVVAALFWILLFFGRPFWGDSLYLLAISPDMQLHRVVSGAQVFLLLLGAIAVGRAWTAMQSRGKIALAAILAVAALTPAVIERQAYLANNAKWGRDNLEAYRAAEGPLNATLALVKARGGRVYAGVPAGWGGAHKIGSTPFFAFLSVRQIPAVAYLYNAMALTAEIQLRMNEWNPVHYRLFGIRSVVAPAGIQTALPEFWSRIAIFQRFETFATPDAGYFDVVGVGAAAHVDKHNFYDVNDRWLQSEWANKRVHLLLDLGGPVPAGTPVVWEEKLSSVPDLPVSGTILSESSSGETYVAQCDVTQTAGPAYVLFKMTWHPNWRATVDGRPVPTSMLSPGFIGVPVSAGRHTIQLRYQGSAWKLWLALAGIVAVSVQNLPARFLHR